MENIKKLRISANFTQKQLSKHLKISSSTVAMWEVGLRRPRFDMLPELAKVLNCKIDDLFEEVKEDGITKSKV